MVSEQQAEAAIKKLRLMIEAAENSNQAGEDAVVAAAAGPMMLAALNAVHEPYRTLTREALESGILMEFGPPKPQKGAALLLVRAAIAKAEGRSNA